MRPAYPIDPDTYLIGGKQAVPDGPFFQGIQTNLPENDLILGVNFKVECPNRPLNEREEEQERIENITQKNFANFTKEAIDKF